MDCRQIAFAEDRILVIVHRAKSPPHDPREHVYGSTSRIVVVMRIEPVRGRYVIRLEYDAITYLVFTRRLVNNIGRIYRKNHWICYCTFT